MTTHTRKPRTTNAKICSCNQGKIHYAKDCKLNGIEVVKYYASMLLLREHITNGSEIIFSLMYETTRPLNDNWGTQQGELSFFINGVSRSRAELPASITAEIIAELVATASVIERRVVNQSARSSA